MFSRLARFSDSSWHLRGAISGTLYGFGDQDASVAEFFLAPINPGLNLGLADYDQVVGATLPGIRFLLSTINDTASLTVLRGIPKRVMEHFKFYENYQVTFKAFLL